MFSKVYRRSSERKNAVKPKEKIDKDKLIKLIFPPIWLVILLVLISAGGLAFVFINKFDTSPIAYVIYVVSFYTLAAVTARCIKFVPKKYQAARQMVYGNSLGGKYMTDMKFRTRVSLFGSLGVNLIYVIINAFSGAVYKSWWFITLAIYYAILAVMRFLLLDLANRNGIGNDRVGELRRSRLCGTILLAVNLVLTGAVIMILYYNKGYEYGGIMIYVMALYTFWVTGLAIKNLIKYRRFKSPVMSMSKIISMAAALVSMLSLETAMLTEFGSDMTAETRQLFIILTGAGISAIIIAMSIFSVIKNTIALRKTT